MTYHVRRSRPAPAGHRRAAAGARRPHPAAAARPQPPAVGGLPRRGAGRGPLRHRHQDPPGPGRRRQRRRHRPGHRRRRPRPPARACSRHVAARAASPAASSWSPAPWPTRCARPSAGRRDRPRRGQRRHGAPSARCAGRGRRRRLDRWPGSRPGPRPTRPLNAEVGEARRYVMVGTDLEDYRKVRTRLAAARSPTRSRSTTSSSPRRRRASAPGCSPAASRSTPARRSARWCR